MSIIGLGLPALKQMSLKIFNQTKKGYRYEAELSYKSFEFIFHL